MAEDPKEHEIRKARRRRLTERLEALRERATMLELELREYTQDFFRVCIFGSARIKPDDLPYKLTYRLAYLLAREGIDVLTGGGPGLMEAANKGAKDGASESSAKPKTFGIAIDVPRREPPNPHLDIKHQHRKFSSRLDDFMLLSNAVIVTPGGVGTLLELFFSWQLIQFGHLTERPVILVGSEFWNGLIAWMKTYPLAQGLVSQGDFRWVHIVDTPEEALDIVEKEHQKFKDRLAAQGL